MNIISNKIDELKEDLLSDIIDIVKYLVLKGVRKWLPFWRKSREALNKALEISENWDLRLETWIIILVMQSMEIVMIMFV